MKGPLFYAKILLFGEYGIIKDSKGLAIPYNSYQGSLIISDDPGEKSQESNQKLRAFYQYLKELGFEKPEDDFALVVVETQKSMVQRIDEKLPDHLEAFIESRKTIGHVHGLQAYGHVMNYFAAAERYLNRVWSASADGYIDEITEYMERSEQQFEEALAALRDLGK